MGAGVAGAATALRLARHGMRVALIDASAPPAWTTGPASGDVGVELQLDADADRRPEGRRLRVPQLRQGGASERRPYPHAEACEVLAPSAVHALAALGVDDARMLGGGDCRGVLSRWHGDTAGFTDFELLGCTPGRIVNRGVVARRLVARAADAGAVVVMPGRVRAERSRARWSLGPARHPQRDLACRHLIDATGRSGRSVAMLPVRRHHDRAVCLSTKHTAPLLDPTVLVVDRSTHGWWYAIAGGDSATDVAFVTDADLLPSARARAAWLATEYREATLIMASLDGVPPFVTLTSRDARSGHRTTAAGNGWLAVGDAALSWDPLSGHGMQFALESAEHAAEAIVAGDAERLYPAYLQWCGDAVREYDRARASMYGAATTVRPDSEFWRRREPASDGQPVLAAPRRVT